MGRGRKRLDGDRYPSGKLKQRKTPKLPPYRLEVGREALRLADHLWRTRPGRHNLDGRLPDDLAATAYDCRVTLIERHMRLDELTERPASHDTRDNLRPSSGDYQPEETPIPGLIECIDKLPPRERKAILEYCGEDRHPDSWDILQVALKKIHRTLGRAPAPTKAEVEAGRRSDVARAIPGMLVARGLQPDDPRAMVAIASANVGAFAKLNAAWFAVAVEKAQAKFPDFDLHHAAILQALRDGAVPRTASPTHDVETAYHFIKKGGRNERTATHLAQAK